MGSIRSKEEIIRDLEELDESYWTSKVLLPGMNQEYYRRRDELASELMDNYGILYE